MTDDLLTWLPAQFDAEEQAATSAADGGSGQWTYKETPGGHAKVVDGHGYDITRNTDVESQPWFTGPHIARQDPARTLRAVAAKRRIFARHSPRLYWGVLVCARACTYSSWPCPDVLDLAAEYADQPGYQPEWGPQ